MTVDFDQHRKDLEGTACLALEEQGCSYVCFSTRAFVVCQIFWHCTKVHGSSSLHFTAADYSKLQHGEHSEFSLDTTKCQMSVDFVMLPYLQYPYIHNISDIYRSSV